MALSTVRGAEVTATRHVDKQFGIKAVAGPPSQVLALASAAVQLEGMKVDSHDSSPDSRAVSRAKAVITEGSGGLRVPSTSSVVDDVVEAEVKDTLPSRTNSAKPVELKLEACPSFAEQKPEGKPLWLDRHNTLKTVHMQTVGGLSSPSASPVRSSDPFGADEVAQWLPGWEISRSKLWLMVETALLQAKAEAQVHTPVPLQPQPAATSPTPAAPLHEAAASPLTPPTSSQIAPKASPGRAKTSALASVPETAHEETPDTTPQPTLSSQPSAPAPEPAAAASGPSASAPAPSGSSVTRSTPFAAVPTQLSIAQQEAKALGISVHTNLTRLGSTLRRSCSVAVRAPPPVVPLGLGPVPLTFQPALIGLRSFSLMPRVTIAQQQVLLAASAPAAASAAALPRPKQQHVAYAAGVAAATSTAATVSQALHAAAAGVAVVTDPHNMGATALQLGANAVQAGATFLMNKFQSATIAKSTVAAAEAVLGPEASDTTREELRKRLRTTVAGLSVIWFLMNLHGMSDTLAHLDFDHDFVSSTRVVMKLATSGPAFMENCRELLQVGVAVGMGLAQRNSAATAGLFNAGDSGSGEMAAQDAAYAVINVGRL